MTNIEFSSDLTTKLIAHSASDEMVVASARVSTSGPDSQDYIATYADESKGLINFLMKNRHGTPFEHNMFTFFVDAPIAVFREFHRHRIGWSYNEESGRYKKLRPKCYVPPKHRPLVQVGKPGHYTFEPGAPDQYQRQVDRITRSYSGAYSEYEEALEDGVAKEVARGVLPVYQYSSMYATCNARSLMHFLGLRTKSPVATFKSFPMWEIEQVALQMELEFERYMPITYNAWYMNGRVAP